MLQISVGNSENGKRLDRFLFSTYPDIPGSAIFKAFKKKDVKINGKRAKEDILVAEGDVVSLYLPPESLAGMERGAMGNDLAGISERFSEPHSTLDPVIAYEDDALLIVIKPQGILVQDAQPVADHYGGAPGPDDSGFDELVRTWWAANRPPLPTGFPALCHRLDRNTGGLLMFAKTSEALDAVGQKIKQHQIRKHYQCLVAGTPNPPAAEVKAWLEKDASKGRVYIHETPKTGAVPIVTRYRTLSSGDGISRLDVEIITGRTHQIRAQLARLGHPILGDSKYGSNTVNRRYHIHRQALWSYRLDFLFPPIGPLSEVAGRTVECTDIPWDFQIGLESPAPS